MHSGQNSTQRYVYSRTFVWLGCGHGAEQRVFKCSKYWESLLKHGQFQYDIAQNAVNAKAEHVYVDHIFQSRNTSLPGQSYQVRVLVWNLTVLQRDHAVPWLLDDVLVS